VESNNRAARRSAAKAAGVKGQLVSATRVVEVDPDDSNPNDSDPDWRYLAVAIADAIDELRSKGGAPLERCVVTIGQDHPGYPGRLVVEAKTDRMAPRAVELKP